MGIELLQCAVCGGKVASSAVSCPHCGAIVADFLGDVKLNEFRNADIIPEDKFVEAIYFIKKSNLRTMEKFEIDRKFAKLDGKRVSCMELEGLVGLFRERIPDFETKVKSGRYSCIDYILYENSQTAVCSKLYEDAGLAITTETLKTTLQRSFKAHMTKYGEPLYSIGLASTSSVTLKNNSTGPKCPICRSSNITKISTVGRTVSVGLFGLGSSSVGKTMHCLSCNYKF